MKVFVAFVLMASLGLTLAITPEEVNILSAAAQEQLLACAQKHSIPEDSVADAQKNKNVDSLDSCFFSCAFKKDGVINDAGLYDTEAFKGIYKKLITNENTLKELDGAADSCARVNEESVSDGDKGCDRSKLLFTCLLQEKAKIVPQ